MIQHNQVGKYRKKDEVLDAKIGRTFVLPSGKKYVFEKYEKIGQKYIFTISYKGNKCQFKEVDYNTIDMELFLCNMEEEIQKINSGFYNPLN